MTPRDVLQIRAEVAMWGAIAAAGPWLIAGHKAVGGFFTIVAVAAWLVAKLQGAKR